VDAQLADNEHIRDTIRRANEDVHHLEHTSPSDTVNNMANFGSVQVGQTVEPWIPLLYRAKSFVLLVDKVAEVK
jgi:hypothetical protein